MRLVSAGGLQMKNLGVQRARMIAGCGVGVHGWDALWTQMLIICARRAITAVISRQSASFGFPAVLFPPTSPCL